MTRTIALAVPGIRDETEVLAAAARAGLDIRRRCVDSADLLGACLSAPGLTAVITVQLPRLSAEVISRLHACGCTVVGVAVAPGDHDRLAALGVDAVLDGGLDGGRGPDEMAEALIQALNGNLTSSTAGAVAANVEALVTSEAGPPGGRVIIVWGPPGAPGRTTTAVMIARHLAERARTAILDLDLQAPSLALQLGLNDDLSGLILASRHAEAGSLNSRTLVSTMSLLSTGLLALTGISHARRAPEVRPIALERILEQVRHDFAYAVIDVAASVSLGSVSESSVAAACASSLTKEDAIVAVCRAEPLGVARFLADLPELAGQHSRIIVVLTGGGMRQEAQALIGEEARRLGIPIAMSHLELDSRALAGAVRKGDLLRRRRGPARRTGSTAHVIDLVA